MRMFLCIPTRQFPCPAISASLVTCVGPNIRLMILLETSQLMEWSQTDVPLTTPLCLSTLSNESIVE